MMLSFDFLTPFYNQRHIRDTLLKNIEGVVAAHELNIRALPFYSSISPTALLEETAKSAEWRFHALHEEEGLTLFNGVCSSSNGSQHPQEHQREGRFFVWVHSEYPRIYVLLTLESSWFFQRLVALIEKSYPQAVTTFITHRRLRRLLEAFVEQNSFSRLVIRRASLRVRFDEDHPAEDERVMKMVSWPNMELGEAFDWVYQHNGWFQSLQFDACQDHRVLASVSFTRQGVLRTNALVSQAFASFVEPVCKTIDENVRFFGQRCRRSRSDLSVRPLVVDFQVDQVADPDQRHRFIKAMQRLRGASVSVLHGNPYVHLSVLDYYDGSAFDVWVLSGSEITIVPQMKGSMAAIKRLVHHIFDSYAEGHIREYEGGHV